MAEPIVRRLAPAGAAGVSGALAPPLSGLPGRPDTADGAAPNTGWLDPGRVAAALRTWAGRQAELLTASTVLLLAFTHLLRVYNRGFNLLDEGFVLHVAERVMQGQVPYRDFFTQLTPGAFLALAAIFQLTGPSVIVGRWVTVALGLHITLLLYVGGRRLLPRPVAAFAALAFPVWGIAQGWFYPNYSWFALAAAITGFWCLLRAVDSARRRWWLAGAGLLCGLSAFCKQNLGLYALVALVTVCVLALPVSRRERLLGAGIVVLAALPIPVGFLLWLAAQGALPAFYRDAVWIPLAVFPQEMAAPYPRVWPPWPAAGDKPGQAEWAFRLICLLPPLPFGLTVAKLGLDEALRRLRRQGATAEQQAQRAALTGWLAFGFAIWATAFPRADFDHIQVAIGPLFILGAVFLHAGGRGLVRCRVWRLWGAAEADLPAARPLRSRRDPRRWLPKADWCRRHLATTVACVLLSGFLVEGLGNARALHMGPGWTLRTMDGVAPRAAGILLDHDDAAVLNRLVAEVRRLSAPGESIVSLPWNAGLYFLAERRNASRFDLIIPASVLPDDLPEIEEAIDRARLIVYWTSRDSFIDNTALDDRLPELHEHIVSNYRMVAAVSAYRLFLRNTAPS